jgi:hypothetical protein
MTRRSCLATVALAVVLAACGSTPQPMRDPGTLEIWNGLRDELLVVISGRGYPVPACRITAFEGVDLRGVILASSGGIQVAAFPADARPTPIGPRRYLLVGAAHVFGGGETTVHDLRTRPNAPEPDGRTCRPTVDDLIERRPVEPIDELEQIDVG